MSEAAQTQECFRRIGVWGDRSCELLVEHAHCRNCSSYAAIGRQLLDRSPNTEYLVEWRDRVARKGSGVVAEAARPMTVFRVADEWLALPTQVVREIVDPMPVRRVPHRRDISFRGLVNVRGVVLPCVDLGVLLGSRSSAQERGASADAMTWRRMMVIESAGAAWTFEAEEVEGIRRVRDGQLRRPPVTVELGTHRFTEWVFTDPHGDVGVLEEALLFHRLQRVSQ